MAVTGLRDVQPAPVARHRRKKNQRLPPALMSGAARSFEVDGTMGALEHG